MARPIDAGVLQDNLTDIYGDGNGLVYLKDVLGLIDEQPTLTPPNEWGSVEERLPENHAQVLMWSAKWNIAEAGSYYNGRFWVYSEIGDAYIADDITHWMPLPAPPDRRPPEGEEDT